MPARCEVCLGTRVMVIRIGSVFGGFVWVKAYEMRPCFVCEG